MMGAYHNEEIVLLPSAARTATPAVSDYENLECRGVKVVIDVKALTGTPSLTIKIQGKDPASGKYFDILTSAAITATGTTVLTVYPGITAATNSAASDVLPKTWRVLPEHANADSITYSVGAMLVK